MNDERAKLVAEIKYLNIVSNFLGGKQSGIFTNVLMMAVMFDFLYI